MIVEGSGGEKGEAMDSGSEPESSTAAPEFIYFYYIKRPTIQTRGAKNESDHIRHEHGELRVFFVKNEPNGKLDDRRIKDLIDKADCGVLSPIGYAVNDLTLRHRGYMLFVWRENGKTLEDVTFLWHRDRTKKNHSFKNFKKMQSSGDLSGVYCVNKRLAHDGGPLGQRTETFDVEFTTNPRIVWIHDEVATNTGP